MAGREDLRGHQEEGGQKEDDECVYDARAVDGVRDAADEEGAKRHYINPQLALVLYGL